MGTYVVVTNTGKNVWKNHDGSVTNDWIINMNAKTSSRG